MIRVTGDKEVAAGLARLRASTPVVEDKSGLTGARLIAAVARARVPSGPSAGGHASSSVVPIGKSVVGGGPAFPYFPWLDFGGAVGRRNSVRRPFMKTGRYIWRGYVTTRPLIENAMEDNLEDAARASGLDVT